MRAAAAPGDCPSAAAPACRAHPQHRLQRRELERRDAECLADLVKYRPGGRGEAVALQRRFELNLQEHPPQVATTPDQAAQFLERLPQREVAALALGEEGDRAPDVGVAQREPPHRRARSLDLLFGDPAVGLCDLPHDLERRAKESRAQDVRIGAAEPPRRSLAVELVTDQEADQSSQPATTHDRADQRAEQLAVPTHGFLDRRWGRLQHRALS